ncbi:MAG TPA: Lsr2 family protein [Streptosporangiaceae bacterium]|nr:Lsr2 family protein [Streptosporangiaceae bacterium]
MAQRVEILFIDDIDGTPAAETIRFGIAGVDYEIDLSAEHAKEFREAMAPFVAGARRGTAGPRQARSTRAGGPSPAAVRQWAKSAGIEVSDRGRVPDDLIARFQAANR